MAVHKLLLPRAPRPRHSSQLRQSNGPERRSDRAGRSCRQRSNTSTRYTPLQPENALTARVQAAAKLGLNQWIGRVRRYGGETIPTWELSVPMPRAPCSCTPLAGRRSTALRIDKTLWARSQTRARKKSSGAIPAWESPLYTCQGMHWFMARATVWCSGKFVWLSGYFLASTADAALPSALRRRYCAQRVGTITLHMPARLVGGLKASAEFLFGSIPTWE